MSAALALIASRGYENVSIDEIAAATGNTKGAAYHHFESKPALYRAALESLARELTRSASVELDEKLPLHDAVKALLVRLVHGVPTSVPELSSADVYYLFFDGMRRFPDLADEFQRLFRVYLSDVAGRLGTMSRARNSRRVEAEALQCLVWLEGIALIQAVTGGMMTEEQVEEMVDRFFG